MRRTSKVGDSMGTLDNKIAVITGAARGIGRATAELFVYEGATVYATDISEPTASFENERMSAADHRRPATSTETSVCRQNARPHRGGSRIRAILLEGAFLSTKSCVFASNFKALATSA
jgi:NAD(P)-dependent dehydrogenase (short-subunit alcohol dehydrogenase family)